MCGQLRSDAGQDVRAQAEGLCRDWLRDRAGDLFFARGTRRTTSVSQARVAVDVQPIRAQSGGNHQETRRTVEHGSLGFGPNGPPGPGLACSDVDWIRLIDPVRLNLRKHA